MASHCRINDVFSCIDRLDNDSLGIIFDTLARTDPPIRSGGTSHSPVLRYHLGWITSTHVSKRWRSLALSKHSLWANCVSNLPHIFPIMLDRAKDAPLHVKMDFRFVRTKDVTRTITALWGCIDRVQSLRVTLPAGPERDQLRSILSSRKHPRLINLELCFSGVDSSIAPHSPPYLPIDAPNLRTGIFLGIQCHVTAGFNLRSLSIKNGGDTWRSMNELITMLRDYPCLEVLRFRFNPVPLDDDDTRLTDQDVLNLPNLKLLCITCATQDNRQRSGQITDLLRRLSYSPSCIFHYLDFAQRDDMHWRPAFDIYEERTCQLRYDALTVSAGSDTPLGPPFVATVFSTGESAWPSGFDHPNERISKCCSDDAIDDWDVVPGVRLATSSIRRWKVEDLLSNLIPRLQSETITHLTLRGLIDVGKIFHPDMTSILRSLSAVQFLYLPMRFRPAPLELERPVQLLPRLTALPPSHSAVDPDTEQIMPALRVLIVHQENMYTLCSEEVLEDWWSSLCEWLMRLKQPLNTLRLMGNWEKMPEGLRALDESKKTVAKEFVEELRDDRVLPWH